MMVVPDAQTWMEESVVRLLTNQCCKWSCPLLATFAIPTKVLQPPHVCQNLCLWIMPGSQDGEPWNLILEKKTPNPLFLPLMYCQGDEKWIEKPKVARDSGSGENCLSSCAILVSSFIFAWFLGSPFLPTAASIWTSCSPIIPPTSKEQPPTIST